MHASIDSEPSRATETTKTADPVGAAPAQP